MLLANLVVLVVTQVVPSLLKSTHGFPIDLCHRVKRCITVREAGIFLFNMLLEGLEFLVGMVCKMRFDFFYNAKKRVEKKSPNSCENNNAFFFASDLQVIV